MLEFFIECKIKLLFWNETYLKSKKYVQGTQFVSVKKKKANSYSVTEKAKTEDYSWSIWHASWQSIDMGQMVKWHQLGQLIRRPEELQIEIEEEEPIAISPTDHQEKNKRIAINRADRECCKRILAEL